MDSGPLRPVPTKCLKIDVFLFLLVHWNTLCTIKQCAVLIVTVILLMIDYYNYYITFGFLLCRLTFISALFAFTIKITTRYTSNGYHAT